MNTERQKMSRITQYNPDVGYYIPVDTATETDLNKATGEEVLTDENTGVSKLADYENSEEQGLLVRLPCKVGDKIYCIDPYEKRIVEDRVANIKIEYDYEDGFYGEFSGYGHVSYRKNFLDIGKTIFLTHEEAEKGLPHG